MAVYPISQLLDLAHSPLVATPEQLKNLDMSLFQARQRVAPHQPNQPREPRARGKNSSQWKNPTSEMQGMELVAKDPSKRTTDTQNAVRGHPDDSLELMDTPHSESTNKPDVDLWDMNIPTFQKKDGSSRFTSLFGPQGTPVAPSNPQTPPIPPSTHSGQSVPPQTSSVMGMFNNGSRANIPSHQSPLNSLGSLQSTLPPGMFGIPGQPPSHDPSVTPQSRYVQPGNGSVGPQGPQGISLGNPGSGVPSGPPVGPPPGVATNVHNRAPPMGHGSPPVPGKPTDTSNNDLAFFNSLLTRSQPNPNATTPSKTPRDPPQSPGGFQPPGFAMHPPPSFPHNPNLGGQFPPGFPAGLAPAHGPESPSAKQPMGRYTQPTPDMMHPGMFQPPGMFYPPRPGPIPPQQQRQMYSQGPPPGVQRH